MKILHIMPSFGLGGMEKVICSFINGTREYRHIVIPLDGNRSANIWITHGEVQYIDFYKPSSRVNFFMKLYNIIKKVQPGLIMSYNWGGTDALWLGKIAKVKRIVHSEHGFNIDESKYTSKSRDFLRMLLYRLASRIIVVSSYLDIMMKEKYFLRSGCVSFIPNGINTDHFCPDSGDRERVRRRLGFTDEDIVVVFCGRLDPVKNFGFMLEIIKYCKGIRGNIKLLIIGDGPEGRRIREMAAVQKIDEKLRLVGERGNVLPFLRASDVFLITSFREQMPISVLEAMSVGLPILAPRTGELPSIIEYGKEGFLRELDDGPEEFGKLVLALDDRGQRKRMGEAARKKVVAFFGEEAMIQKYRAIIQDLAGI
jgi:glycosyltransferase involved in cell wall biosynthesis